MRVIGLTGGIGSGKTTVANLFSARHGVPVIDTDQIAHDLTSSGGRAMPLIRSQFGPEFLVADGSLNRPLMRDRIFGDPGSRRKLETILHPLIRQEVKALLKSIAAPYTLVVIPLLVETGGYDFLDRVLVVDCEPQTQIARTMARSGLRREEIQAILDVQADREYRLGRADDVIQNDGSPEDLIGPVDVLNAKYSLFAAGKP